VVVRMPLHESKQPSIVRYGSLTKTYPYVDAHGSRRTAAEDNAAN
jgi:hypothetical protein